MPGMPPMGMPQPPMHNMMPSINYQMQNMQLNSNKNQYYQNMNSNSGMNRPMTMQMPMDQNEQMNQYMAQSQMMNHPPPTSKISNSQAYANTESGSQPMMQQPMMQQNMIPMMPNTTPIQPTGMSVSKIPPPFNPMNMVEMTRNFLSSMKDLSNKNKATGVLKFFNENKGFGFFVSDIDGKDVFFHFEDLKDVKISKDFLREAKNKYIVKFAFTMQVYYGKYSYSTKAVDIELLGLISLKFLQKNENLTN
jgi:hypothetical protein